MATSPAPTEPAAPPKANAKGKLIQFGVVLVLMAIEGVAIFYFANSLSPPPAAAKAEGAESANGPASESDQNKLSELPLAECRASNRASGKLVYFQVKVVALVQPSRLEEVTKVVQAHSARIQDRINFVFRSADLANLSEPNLDTIKRRIKAEVDRILDDDKAVTEVLMPDFTPSGGGL